MLRPQIHLPTPRPVHAPSPSAIGTTALLRSDAVLPAREAVDRLLRATRRMTPEMLAERGEAIHAEHRVPAVRPERCCVYCGHDLFVPPKTERVRCPVCTRELSVLDVLLTGDVAKSKEIVSAGRITVAVGSRVAADLVACTIEVGGKLLGDVVASQTCRIRCTAKVSGHILCRYLTIEPGAEIDGSIETISD